MIRRILFWTHLTIGATAGIVILIMSVTGVLLAFERQLLHLADRDVRTVSAAGPSGSLPIARLLAAAARSGARPTAIVLRPGPIASVEVVLGRDRSVYVDPYSGAVLGESSAAMRAFFAAVERWHRTLGEPLGTRGPLRSIAAAANLLFFGLVLTGAYLWLPRTWTWQALRPAVWFRRGLRGRARDWNWHNAIALWCAIPLLLITLSGVIMSYPWANALLFRLAGSPVPVRQEPGRPAAGGNRSDVGRESPKVTAADLDRAAAVARSHTVGWRTITLRVPAPDDPSVTASVDTGAGGEVEKRTELVVDTRTGEVVRKRGFSDNTLGQRLRSLARFIHTGEEGGLPGQVVAAVASAGGVLLVWTGISMAIRRFVNARRRRMFAASRREPAA